MGQCISLSLTYFISPTKENYSNNDFFSLFAHTETLFINLEILPPNKLILNRIAIMMYKYTNNMLPSVMHELYKKNNEIHTYDTRNKGLFRIDKGQKGLNIYVNSYSNISARLWSALMPKLNTNVSLPKFKSLLKQFLLFNTIEIQYHK